MSNKKSIPKYQYGGPGYFTSGNVNIGEGTKQIAQWILKGLGKVGDAFNTIVTAGASTDFGQTSPFVFGTGEERRNIANPDQVTFHGGYSRWNGQNNVNDFMIGVEFQGDTNKRPLTNQQIQSYVEYVKPIVRQYGIPLENIVTHQNVRDEYNAWAPLNGEPTAPSKPDINQENQRRLIEALRQSLYIQK